MSLFTTFHGYICKVLQSLNSSEEVLDLSKVTIEPTRDPLHGDIATNAAMVMAKQMGLNPRELAAKITEQLTAFKEIEKVDIAGPGFINLTLSPFFWHAQLKEVLVQKEHYGDSEIGNGEKVNVEFVSTNPTGPLHTGHGRNAILGDAIASLLQKAGYKVCREYYVNDAGGQTNALARSVHLRYREALGEAITIDDFKDGMYPGGYLIPVGQKIANEYKGQWTSKPESEWLDLFREIAVAEMMKDIRADLEKLGVVMDVYTSEKALVKAGKVDETLKLLKDQGDVYEGVLTPPKGHVVDDWEERSQTLFKATAYGDDVDRPLQKSDGSWTYFAGDIAYHVDKFERGFSHMIDVWGADHSGYVKRLTSAVKAATQGKTNLEIKVCQMVNFLENGAPVRMSKRAGTFITINDVIERVGKDAARFMMISRHQDMPIDFDFAKVVEHSKDNPIFYIQYAHARICSVLRHVETVFPNIKQDIEENAQIELLTDESELAMIKLLANWPRQVEVAALVREPHRLANFLYDLASQFHALWNKGKDNTHLRFIDPDQKELTKARITLISAVAIVISSGLTLFGITPVQEMR
ncbi:MAG: arginine--tRNA ligase [Alphaproteobacteria bacterium]|nr:arginine--tRNA ligase [Alphaproteobacteria bacterium]